VSIASLGEYRQGLFISHHGGTYNGESRDRYLEISFSEQDERFWCRMKELLQSLITPLRLDMPCGEISAPGSGAPGERLLESGTVDWTGICRVKRTHPITIESQDKDRLV
jgi:hypothetical protein